MTSVRDIELDANGDLKINAGDLVMTSGLDAIRQSLSIRLQFIQGEWFLDLGAGVPYFKSVLIKSPNINSLQSIFRKAILETPGVTAVNKLQLDFDRAARTLSVTIEAQGDEGLIEIVQEF